MIVINEVINPVTDGTSLLCKWQSGPILEGNLAQLNH